MLEGFDDSISGSGNGQGEDEDANAVELLMPVTTSLLNERANLL